MGTASGAAWLSRRPGRTYCAPSEHGCDSAVSTRHLLPSRRGSPAQVRPCPFHSYYGVVEFKGAYRWMKATRQQGGDPQCLLSARCRHPAPAAVHALPVPPLLSHSAWCDHVHSAALHDMGWRREAPDAQVDLRLSLAGIT